MRRLFAAVGLCGLTVGVLAADDSPAPPRPSAETLVERLGAEEFADREAAAAALRKLGADAIPALAAAARHPNPEVRDRAAVLLVKAHRAADAPARLAAKRVPLDYADIPLGTAVHDLRARTGLNLVLDPARVADPLRKVTARAAELPVWEAVEAFCAAAGLREAFAPDLDVPKQTKQPRGYVAPPQTPTAESVPVVLIDGPPDRLPGARSTAVRVLALPRTFPGHRVAIGGAELTLCLDVAPAPGLHWQEVLGVKIVRVTDDAGRPGSAGTERKPEPTFDPTGATLFVRPGVVMRFDPRGNPIYPDTVPNPRVLPVPLRVATPGARSLKRLEGAVYGEVLVPNQHLIAVADPKANTGAVTAGEIKFAVLEVREPTAGGGPGLLRVQLEYPSPYAVSARRRNWSPAWPEAPQNPALGYRVEAFDAAGKPFPFTSRQAATDLTDDGLVSVQTVTCQFRAGGGRPAKVVVVGPKLVQVEVPFVMENVPLP